MYKVIDNCKFGPSKSEVKFYQKGKVLPKNHDKEEIEYLQKHGLIEKMDLGEEAPVENKPKEPVNKK